MKLPKRSNEPTALDERIAELLSELESLTGSDPDYKKTREELSALYALKAQDKPEKISPNTLLTVLGNLGIAGVVIAFEKHHVITSKFPQFLTKLK